jgi:hypothetical protein
MDYDTYKKQIYVMAGYTVDPITGLITDYDQNYLTILPEMITYAELRMQRDLDFLSTQTSTTAYSLTANNNTLSIPTSAFVTLQTIQVNDDSGPTPLLPTTKSFLQNVWPNVSGATVPQYFAVYGGDSATAGQTSQNIIFGPWPDSSYNLTLTGTIRSETLSETNPTTFISVYLPDLFIMASMIYMSGYQRNFGRSNDDPQMAITYESQYKSLLMSATVEEFRKKFEAAAWSSMSPAPVASLTRG